MLQGTHDLKMTEFVAEEEQGASLEDEEQSHLVGNL
jgi:hypothetical protein